MERVLSTLKAVWTVFQLRGSAADDPTARTLYALMWGLLPIFLIHGAVGILLTTRAHLGLVSLVNALLVLTPIVSITLLRHEMVQAAGVFYLSGVWLTYTLIILFNGGIHHVGLAVYIALPVCAAWLFGYRAALWVAVACFGSATAMAVLETIGIGPMHVFQGRPVGIWFLLLECTVMGVVPVSMVLSSLRQALTQSQLAEAELQRSQEANLKRQKLESVGVLASGIAHDFNNLLGGILAEAQLVEEEIPATSPAAEEVQKIKTLAVRASEIVRELMVYAGQETADLVLVDLSQIVEEMLVLLKVSISKRAVLQTKLERHTPKVRGQAAQLRQVVMNLIINASEALGEKDGIITVRTAHVTAGPNLIAGGANALPVGNCILLEVSDNGPGVSEEQKSRIFDPFFTTKFAGRGLGLAVVQGVVRSHGGAITLNSRPGKGTTFQIHLPCADEFEMTAKRSEVSASGDRHSGWTGTLLLVEDEDILRGAVAKILRTRGFLVVEVADGSAALDLLRDVQLEIDVMLLDLTIPGAESFKVAEESQRIRPATRIVIMSAYGRDAGSQFLKIPQVAGYIRKPFHAEELVALLREAGSCLQGQPAAAQNQAAAR